MERAHSQEEPSNQEDGGGSHLEPSHVNEAVARFSESDDNVQDGSTSGQRARASVNEQATTGDGVVQVGEDDGSTSTGDRSSDEIEGENEESSNEAGSQTTTTVEFTPSPLLQNQTDPSLNQLSNQEREWALQIKAAVEGSPDIDSLTDLMYAHLGIFSQGDMDIVMDRVYKMQALRKEYGISDTFEESVQMQEMIVQRFPGTFLSFGFDPDLQAPLAVFDPTKADVRKIGPPNRFCECMKWAYYIQKACSPTLTALRKGSVHIWECEGFGKAPGMVDARLLRKLFLEIHGSYPTTHHKFYFYHAPGVFNVMLSLIKRALPENVRSKIIVGCTFPGRLDQFYLVPSLEVATQRTLCNIREALRIRYEHERTFSL